MRRAKDDRSCSRTCSRTRARASREVCGTTPTPFGARLVAGIVVALTVRQDETAHSPKRRMAAGERQQKQSAGRVVADHRGIVHVEQFEAVEHQPGQRGGRSVCSRGQRPGMRSQREVDRDAAVAVLERGNDVTPQVMIRERAGEEDKRRPPAGRSPGQGPEPGFQPFGFHGYKTYSGYAMGASPIPGAAGLIASCLEPDLGASRRAPPPAQPWSRRGRWRARSAARSATPGPG